MKPGMKLLILLGLEIAYVIYKFGPQLREALEPEPEPEAEAERDEDRPVRQWPIQVEAEVPDED